MAARNPTDWTRWLDHRSLISGSVIKAATPDNIRNDQVYVLDAEMMTISDIFEDVSTTAAGFNTVNNYTGVLSKDMCGVSGVTNNEISHEWCVYFFAAAGVTGEARLTSTAVASNTSTLTLTGDGTWKWAGFGTLNVKTNNIADTLLLETRRTAGGSAVIVGGLGLFALTT